MSSDRNGMEAVSSSAAVLLHGFPDTPASWKPVVARLQSVGIRCATPWLPGYRGRRRIHRMEIDLLGRWALTQVARYGATAERTVLVGHDWGAVAAYAAAAIAPDAVQRLVTLSVPPLSVFLRNLSAKQLARSSYMAFAQLPIVAEHSLRQGTWIDRLWRRWSPRLPEALPAKTAAKTALGSAPIAGNALGYYRALRPEPFRCGRWRRARSVAFRRLDVSATVLYGSEDGCIGPEMYTTVARGFTTTPTVAVHPDAGHFLQLEAPDFVADAIRLSLESDL